MVDEAYGEFADAASSCEQLLSECDNLVVLHTLSKAFGMAGTRVGYVIAAPDVIDAFAAIRQIYSVNGLWPRFVRAISSHPWWTRFAASVRA